MMQDAPSTVLLEARGELEFVILMPQEVERCWGQIEGMLSVAAKRGHGELNVSDLKRTMQFAVRNYRTDEIRLIVCVERVLYPNYECCQIVAISGHGALRPPWVADAFLRWAAGTGARYVQGWAKPEVARLWRRIGGKVVYQLVRKELTCLVH